MKIEFNFPKEGLVKVEQITEEILQSIEERYITYIHNRLPKEDTFITTIPTSVAHIISNRLGKEGHNCFIQIDKLSSEFIPLSLPGGSTYKIVVPCCEVIIQRGDEKQQEDPIEDFCQTMCVYSRLDYSKKLKGTLAKILADHKSLLQCATTAVDKDLVMDCTTVLVMARLDIDIDDPELYYKVRTALDKYMG